MKNKGEYIPTTAERKILEALSEPENYTISIKELCEKIGIGRNTYYTACKKAEFIKAKNKILDEVFESLVPEVKKAAVKYAINNAKNFQDRKMILEIAGEYRPQQDVNIKENLDKDTLLQELEKLEEN